MNLRRESSETQHVYWRAGYGWRWNEQLDDVQDFDSWEDAQHWLRLRIMECTLRRYSDPKMYRERDYRWISGLGQDFCMWRVVK